MYFPPALQFCSSGISQEKRMMVSLTIREVKFRVVRGGAEVRLPKNCKASAVRAASRRSGTSLSTTGIACDQQLPAPQSQDPR